MIERLAEILKKSNSIVFFGGAGVSTESGIPDFRSDKGLYSAKQIYGYPPEELLSYDFFVSKPQIFFAYYLDNLIFANVQPNAAHLALAKLERWDKLKAVVTQNIDGLHQLAGSQTVYELHGSVARNYCVSCGARYPLSYLLAPEKVDENVPLCTLCGGIVRPDVVLYGEALHPTVWDSAVAAVEQADSLIVGGTSLAVYPAAGLLRSFQGNRLVIINRSVTSYDRYADLVLRDPISKVLSEAVSLIESG